MSDGSFEFCENIDDGIGVWAVDWSLVRAIVRSHEFNKALVQFGKRKETSQVVKYKPWTWSAPNVVSYEIDWKSVKQSRDQWSRDTMNDIYNRIDSTGVKFQRQRLETMIHQTAQFKATHREKSKAAQREFMQNLNTAVDSWEVQLEVLKAVRDTSFDGVLLGATFLSGGTAAIAIGGGSLAKGFATYTDTGNVGEAAMETVGSVIFTAIPVARGAAGAVAKGGQAAVTEGLLVLTEAKFEVAKGLVAGDSIQEALAKGGLKVVTGTITGKAVGGLAKMQPIQDLLGKTGLPATIAVTRAGSRRVSTGDLGKDFTTGVVNQAIGKVAGPQIQKLKPAKQKVRPKIANSGPTVRCLGSDEICSSLNLLDHAFRRVR